MKYVTRRTRNAGLFVALLAAVLWVGWLSLHVAPAAWLAPAGADVDTSSHSARAVPDYGRLFAVDKVHDIRITIAPDRFHAMQEDLKTIGPPGGMRGFGPPPGARGAPPGGGRGGGPPLGPEGGGGRAGMQEMMEAAVKACEGKPAATACSAGPMGGGKCTDMFDAGQLMCVPEAFARMARGGAMTLTSRDPIVIPVTVTHDGEVWTQVGMRYKGNSSLVSTAASGNGKVPFRLDFNHYQNGDQTFHGFRKLTFSSNFGDDSQLHDTLAGELFRDRGIPAPRTAFYRVFVDSGAGAQYWGLYTMIEDPADGAMLDAQFGSRDGNLYKPDGPGANWTEFDRAGFPKKTNKNISDYGDVERAIRALHAPRDNPQAWRAALEATFNVDLFLRWLALNTVMEDWDSYGVMSHNYYLYRGPCARRTTAVGSVGPQLRIRDRTYGRTRNARRGRTRPRSPWARHARRRWTWPPWLPWNGRRRRHPGPERRGLLAAHQGADGRRCLRRALSRGVGPCHGWALRAGRVRQACP